MKYRFENRRTSTAWRTARGRIIRILTSERRKLGVRFRLVVR